MKAGVTVLSVLLLLYLLAGSRHARSNPAGILVPEEPSQYATVEQTWDKKGYKITALASFRIRALVISTERYWWDAGSELSPLDLALGWGPLSDRSVSNQLSVSQGGRWFRYNPPKGMALSSGEIGAHTANMHMIPADSGIEKQLRSIAPGDVVTLNGYLVQATGANGFRWRSSLTRSDSGAGSCELVWVAAVTKEL